jgi:hypothetical protein
MRLCLFVAADDLSKTAIIFEQIIIKSIDKLGSFTIINFYNILNKNSFSTNDENNIYFLKNKFGNKLNYINPKKKKEFFEYVSKDKIFAIDSLGKTINFFFIRRLINKKNIKLILIMNLGYVSNELPYTINNFKGCVFKFINYFNNLFYKFFVIIKLFPNIFVYFESRKEIYENCIKNKKEKLSFYFPYLNIKYFENIYRINSNSFDRYLKNKNILEEKKIIFLDGNYKHQDIINRENLDLEQLKKKYFERIETFFKWIENIFNEKVEICLHPSSDINEYKNFFKDRKVFINLTNEKIVKSFIIIFHESSSVLDAIIYKKKIISLDTNLFGNYMSSRIFFYKKKLDLFSIKLDNYNNYKNYHIKDILSKLQNSIKNYDIFIDGYLKSDDNELSEDKIIRILKIHE